MEAGIREIAQASGLPLVLYLKSEDGFGSDLEQGLDAIGRLMDEGVGVAIKYAVVRDDPARDQYLSGLMRRVDRHEDHQRHGRTPGRSSTCATSS